MIPGFLVTGNNDTSLDTVLSMLLYFNYKVQCDPVVFELSIDHRYGRAVLGEESCVSFYFGICMK